jgi:hypothetical protein
MTQSLNAFFLIRPNGMVWRCRSAGRPSKPTAEGVGHLQYCCRSIFRLFAKVPWRMTKEAPELQPVVFVIDDDPSLRNALTNLSDRSG